MLAARTVLRLKVAGDKEQCQRRGDREGSLPFGGCHEALLQEPFLGGRSRLQYCDRDRMEIKSTANGVTFRVRVTPRASRDVVDGEFQGALKVRLTAPPVDDRANDALRRFLASRLGVAPSAVTIVSGATSRTKLVSIAGVTEAEAATLARADH